MLFQYASYTHFQKTQDLNLCCAKPSPRENCSATWNMWVWHFYRIMKWHFPLISASCVWHLRSPTLFWDLQILFLILLKFLSCMSYPNHHARFPSINCNCKEVFLFSVHSVYTCTNLLILIMLLSPLFGTTKYPNFHQLFHTFLIWSWSFYFHFFKYLSVPSFL